MNTKEEIQKRLCELLWSDVVVREDLKSALLSLHVSAQRALYLRFWDAMTIEEIARDMRMSWDAVDQLINNSLETLKGAMTKPKSTSANGAA